MIDEQEEREITVIKKAPLVDTKTLVIGGGVVALILFLFFRGGGGKERGKALSFNLRTDGLWLGHYQKFATYSEAIERVKKEGTSAIELTIAGDVPQGEVDKAIAAFSAGGITVLIRQPSASVASVYAKGRGYA